MLAQRKHDEALMVGIGIAFLHRRRDGFLQRLIGKIRQRARHPIQVPRARQVRARHRERDRPAPPPQGSRDTVLRIGGGMGSRQSPVHIPLRHLRHHGGIALHRPRQKWRMRADTRLDLWPVRHHLLLIGPGYRAQRR